MVIFGVHVHVGIRSAAKVWPLVNGLLTYHPHLTALSASSPYWSGEDTGYASNRTMLFQQLPTAGLPFQFETWAQYRAYLADVFTTGVVTDPTELRWDIRPSLTLGTIEVRACDGFARVQDVVAVAALIHCLTAHLEKQLDDGTLPPPLPPWHVQENKWRAARYGLDAIIIRDAQSSEGPVVDDIHALLDRLRADRATARLHGRARRHRGHPAPGSRLPADAGRGGRRRVRGPAGRGARHARHRLTTIPRSPAFPPGAGTFTFARQRLGCWAEGSGAERHPRGAGSAAGHSPRRTRARRC